jgi:hypothetical protein
MSEGDFSYEDIGKRMKCSNATTSRCLRGGPIAALREERDGAGKLRVKFPALLEWRRLRGVPAHTAGAEFDPRSGRQVWKIAMVSYVG